MPEILDEEELKKIRNATLLVSVFYLAAGILLIIFNSQVKEVKVRTMSVSTSSVINPSLRRQGLFPERRALQFVR